MRPLLVKLLSVALTSLVLGINFPTALGQRRRSPIVRQASEHEAALFVSVDPSPYIINPSSPGRASTEIKTNIHTPSSLPAGHVTYRIDIINTRNGRGVYSETRKAPLQGGQPIRVTFSWDGTDRRGRAVADGRYTVTVAARLRRSRGLESRAVASGVGDASIVVDRGGELDRLFAGASPMVTLAAPPPPSDPAASHQPIDANFPFRFYYGSTHSHTIWSDGGVPNDVCSGSAQGPHDGAEPADAYRYAREEGGMDFLAIVEHNHLMNNVCSDCSGDDDIKERYRQGLEAARAATDPGQFVGIYGMEWGVINSGGHINIYNQDNLISWDGEPADITVGFAKYTEVYTAVANNQGATGGSFVTFNHPKSTDFENWRRTANGDKVVRGLAILSGPAESNSTNFDERGRAYDRMYNKALSIGWKVAPESHHDNHCWNYGTSTSSRTVALIPRGDVFNLRSLMGAFGARKVYASEDVNAQLAYYTVDGMRAMGDSFSASAAVAVRVTVNDPDEEGVASIELWAGRARSTQSPGAQPSVISSVGASPSLGAFLNPKPSGQEWYYYVAVVQADGDRIWSSPIWIRW